MTDKSLHMVLTKGKVNIPFKKIQPGISTQHWCSNVPLPIMVFARLLVLLINVPAPSRLLMTAFGVASEPKSALLSPPLCSSWVESGAPSRTSATPYVCATGISYASESIVAVFYLRSESGRPEVAPRDQAQSVSKSKPGSARDDNALKLKGCWRRWETAGRGISVYRDRVKTIFLVTDALNQYQY